MCAPHAWMLADISCLAYAAGFEIGKRSMWQMGVDQEF
jgi:hypothetical protein